jgi:hypothetical protein
VLRHRGITRKAVKTAIVARTARRLATRRLAHGHHRI